MVPFHWSNRDLGCAGTASLRRIHPSRSSRWPLPPLPRSCHGVGRIPCRQRDHATPIQAKRFPYVESVLLCQKVDGQMAHVKFGGTHHQPPQHHDRPRLHRASDWATGR